MNLYCSTSDTGTEVINDVLFNTIIGSQSHEHIRKNSLEISCIILCKKLHEKDFIYLFI